MIVNNIVASAAGGRLRHLRKQQHMSQLELSLRIGVSQRHLSCIETGRARPSREMLLALLEGLDASLAERNETLLAAGYAPAYSNRPLQHRDMTQVRKAIDHLLEAHNPAPALVLDGRWDVLQVNAGVKRLFQLLGADPAALKDDFNLLREMIMPEGLRRAVVNADEVCASAWQMAKRESAHLPALDTLLKELQPFVPEHWNPRLDSEVPLLHTRFRSAAGELTFFSTFTTFGTPFDVTLASLRVEHLFPADEATQNALSGES